MPKLYEVPRGLEGVVVTKTAVSKIDGEKGRLIYRGFDIEELSLKLSFEQVVYLLWYGWIPSTSELLEFTGRLSAGLSLSLKISDYIGSLPSSANPVALLRTLTSMIGMMDSEGQTALESAINLMPKFPLAIATFELSRRSHKLEMARNNASFAENYLRMLTGKIPTKAHTDALNSYFILLADHGLNSSTFSAIVTISTLTDYYSAITSAVGTLKGPLHGGAPSQVWKMLLEIGDRSNTKEWLQRRLESGERIMGFGHRIYRTEDPRSRVLKRLARDIAKPEIFELAEDVEETAMRLLRERHPERPLETNVEFYSSIVLNALGIPTDMFTATFACSRLVGWTAHILEQLADNRLFRPESEYEGPENLTLSKI